MSLAENERQALHVAPIRCLAELHSLLFESFACLVHVRHCNTDVSESSRVLVARMVLEVGVIFRTPIVRELHATGLEQEVGCRWSEITQKLGSVVELFQ